MACPEKSVLFGEVVSNHDASSYEQMTVNVEEYGDVLVLLSSVVWRGLPLRPGERVKISGITDMGGYWQALQACAVPANCNFE